MSLCNIRKRNFLDQCFLNSNVHMNHLVKMKTLISRFSQALKGCQCCPPSDHLFSSKTAICPAQSSNQYYLQQFLIHGFHFYILDLFFWRHIFDNALCCLFFLFSFFFYTSNLFFLPEIKGIQYSSYNIEGKNQLTLLSLN